MLRPDDERALQDYLDGRLSPEARAAFERRLAREPDLAARLSADRSVGRALRSDLPDLDPDFYARARERFEQTTGERWRPRALPWEALGLAAAAVLALAIFLPPLLQHEESVSVPSAAEPTFVGTAPAAPPAAGPVLDAGADTEGIAVEDEGGRGADLGDGRGARELERREDRPEPLAQGAEEEEKDRRLQSPAYAGSGPEPEPETPEGSYSPAPPLLRQSADESAREMDADTAGGFASSEGAAKRAAPGSRIPAERSATAKTRLLLSAAPPRVVPLPAGVVDPGALRSVTDPDAWAALERGPGGPALRLLGGWRAGARLVLLGSRPGGVDCASVEVGDDPGAPQLLLVLPPSAEPSGGGCALVVPDDGRPIVVEEANR